MWHVMVVLFILFFFTGVKNTVIHNNNTQIIIINVSSDFMLNIIRNNTSMHKQYVAAVAGQCVTCIQTSWLNINYKIFYKFYI